MERLHGVLSAGQNMSGSLSNARNMQGSLSPAIVDYYTKQQADARFAEKDVVSSYATHYEFPNIGKQNTIYIATEENKTYRWDESERKYYCIGANYDDIKVITGGEANG